MFQIINYPVYDENILKAKYVLHHLHVRLQGSHLYAQLYFLVTRANIRNGMD